MAMGSGTHRGIVCDMNVTPMIDVLLVLIIVFMIINTATVSRGLDAQVPHPANPGVAEPPTRTVVVQLVNNGNDRPFLKINQEPVAWSGLRARIVEIYQTRAERVMFVRADRGIAFADVANVIDTAQGAFADMRIGLMR